MSLKLPDNIANFIIVGWREVFNRQNYVLLNPEILQQSKLSTREKWLTDIAPIISFHWYGVKERRSKIMHT